MEQSNTDACRKTFRCLIADDSAFARKNIGTIVSRLGGSVVGEAANGNEAVDLYFKLSPDLLLLDITMPELDGVDTLRKIMERDGNAKVIMVSSIGHKEMVLRAMSLGAKHFVIKPYNHGYAGMIIKSVVDDGNGGARCDTNL
jgi:two-component system chemotaxis response regulator CheY